MPLGSQQKHNLLQLLENIEKQESFYGNYINVKFALDYKLIIPKHDIKFYGFAEYYSLTIYGKWILFRWNNK